MKAFLKPENRVKGAGVLLCISLIGWPLSIITFAKDEPVFILSLSWLALTLTCLDVLATTQAAKEQDDDE